MFTIINILVEAARKETNACKNQKQLKSSRKGQKKTTLDLIWENRMKRIVMISVIYYLKDTHREKAPSNKTPTLTKSINMDIQGLVHQINSLYEILKLKLNFRKKKIVTGKTSFFIIGHFTFYLSYHWLLIAVLYRNVAFSILVLSTKTRYSSFLKRVYVFQKICFKVKALKTFEISSHCHIKTYQSLKRRAIVKIASTVF